MAGVNRILSVYLFALMLPQTMGANGQAKELMFAALFTLFNLLGIP